MFSNLVGFCERTIKIMSYILSNLMTQISVISNECVSEVSSTKNEDFLKKQVTKEIIGNRSADRI